MNQLISTKAPIFILGIQPRSGTNFLCNLLSIHPECSLTRFPFAENYFNFDANLLAQYTDYLFIRLKYIQQNKDLDTDFKKQILTALGNGLLELLYSRMDDPSKRLITKTPSVRNLKHFFDLFPSAYLIVLIRDGRAVVESSVKSFGWEYEYAAQKWNQAACDILNFQKYHLKDNTKYLLVRYEDVCSSIPKEMEKILGFLDLNLEGYNFAAAQNLPVKGSSVFRGESVEVNWQPVEKSDNFDILPRWHHWEEKLHERFNWIAGESMQLLGYEIKQDNQISILGKLKNQFLDRYEPTKELITKINNKISKGKR